VKDTVANSRRSKLMRPPLVACMTHQPPDDAGVVDKKPQISPLRYAPPDFLWNLVALAHFMLLSLTKAAHAAMSSAAWQEIRVRSR
jgi:hypothetical protein